MSTNREDIDRLLRPQAPPLDPSIDALIEKHSAANGVDPDLIRRLIHQESGGHGRVTSPKGAQGYMQLMPGTAKGLGVTDPFDPDQNIGAGTKYLRQQLDRFGDVNLALAAYNAGPDRVAKRGAVPPFRETQNYVKSIAGGYKGTGYHPETSPRAQIDSMLEPPAMAGGSETPSMQPVAEMPKPSPEPQQFLKSTEPTYKPPEPPKGAKPATEMATGETYDVPLAPFDKEHAGALGVIGNAGQEAQQKYGEWVRRNMQGGKVEAELSDETNAQTFLKIQQYLAQNPDAKPEEQMKGVAQIGVEFLNDPATKGKQLPKSLHDAMLRAPYTPDELQTLPPKIQQQRQQLAADERRRQEEAALQKQTVTLAKRTPETLAGHIAWHFGQETLNALSSLPASQQRKIALMAVHAANEDDRKRRAGQREFVQDAGYQAQMRQKAGVTDDVLAKAKPPAASRAAEQPSIAFKDNLFLATPRPTQSQEADSVQFREIVNARSRAFEPRTQSWWEKVGDDVSTLVQKYMPGIANIDTPMGIKSDPVRGALHAVTLGALGDEREISNEELLVNPDAKATAGMSYGAGEIIGSLLPLIAVGKGVQVAAAATGLKIPAALQTAATFGLIDAGHQTVAAMRGKPVDWTSPPLSAGLGFLMEGLAGQNPNIVRRVIAFVAPTLALDVARGVPPEQAAKDSFVNAGFALAGGKREGAISPTGEKPTEAGASESRRIIELPSEQPDHLERLERLRDSTGFGRMSPETQKLVLSEIAKVKGETSSESPSAEKPETSRPFSPEEFLNRPDVERLTGLEKLRDSAGFKHLSEKTQQQILKEIETVKNRQNEQVKSRAQEFLDRPDSQRVAGLERLRASAGFARLSPELQEQVTKEIARLKQTTEVKDAGTEPILEQGRPPGEPHPEGANVARTIEGRSEPQGLREGSKSAQAARQEAPQTEDVPRSEAVNADKALSVIRNVTPAPSSKLAANEFGSAFWEELPSGGRVATSTRRARDTFEMEKRVEESGKLNDLYEQGAIREPTIPALRRAAIRRFAGDPIAIENAYHAALNKLTSIDVSPQTAQPAVAREEIDRMLERRGPDRLSDEEYRAEIADSLKRKNERVATGEGLAKVDKTEPEQPTSAAVPERPAEEPTKGVQTVPVTDLNLDPARFQYKLNPNKKGETGVLAGVKEWNPNFEGVVSVWRDPADGKTYVVNGHNRVAKAQELGVENLSVRYIDAPTEKEARAVGALQNIAEGNGTALDAAKFLKDTGKTIDDLKAEGVPLTRTLVRDGAALAKLDDFVFNAVVRGDLDQEHGVAIGAKIDNPDLQNQAYKAIAKAAEKGKPLTKDVVNEMLDAIGAAPRTSETEATLFGDITNEKSLFAERASVAASTKRQLSADRSLFGTAARKSERLKEGGTTVDVEQAKALQESASEALGVFDRLKNRSGPVSDVLDESARKVASGQRPETVAKEAYEQIKRAVNETLGRGVQESGEAGDRPGERAEEQKGQRSLAEAPEGEPALSFGPGAANVGDVPAESTMGQLSAAIGKIPKGKGMRETTRAALDAADKVSQGKDWVVRGLARMKAIGESVLTRPVVTEYKKALGDFLYSAQRSDHETRQFAKQIKKKVPSKLRREAITNYIQADGDMGILAQRAQVSKLRLRMGYEEAAKLTDEEKTIATNISSYFESRWNEAHEAGILNGVVENYVNQAWARKNPITDKLMSDVQRGLLEPNFKFARQRVFESFFEGEQAGYKPLSKDIGTLLSIYNQSLDRAIYSRRFIRSLHDSTAGDGRPLVEISGSGVPVPKGEEPPDQYSIRPHTKQPNLMEQVQRKKAGEEPLDISDYRVVDHPALRGWKWLTNAEAPKLTEEDEVDVSVKTGEPKKEYTPIYMKGDMLVHPEAVDHLKNVLGRSAFAKYPALRAIKRVQTTIKGTMFSLSGFHQVQEATHALGHRVNPVTGTVKLNFDDPTQSLLVKRGLQVASFDGLQEFSEGITGGNLVNKIPVVGSRVFQPYQDWLFRDYIPRLKMTMALDAFERNTKRYKDLNADQVAELTAEQSNAAFGELNYRYMGRNPTYQDVLRTFLLAPDFLEARGRFVGQAVKPYGREQLAALGLLAMTQYMSARVLNKLLDDDYHFEPENAFRVMYGKRWYGLRTVPADIAHLISDPRGFAYHRLSPLAVAGITATTGRDDRGQKLDAAEQIKNFLESPEPIVLKRHTDDAWWESFANSMGLQEGRYYTPTEEVMRDYYNEKFPGGFPKSADPERQQLKRDIVKRQRAGQDQDDEIDRLVEEGKLSKDDLKELHRKGKFSSLQSSFIPLSLDVAITAVEKAKPDQKEELLPLLKKKAKRGLKKFPEAQRDALKERIDKLEE